MEMIRTLPTADGAMLGYRLFRGAAAPRRLIVLLHGVASNISLWSEFVEHTSLKQTWDLLRSTARSRRILLARQARPGNLVPGSADILDAEGHEQALLIGHSLGAQVAVLFAARYQTRVRGLVLIDPIFHQALRGGMRVLSRLRPAVSLLAVLLRLLNRLGLRRLHIPVRDLRKLDEKTRQDLLAAGKQTEMIELYSSPWEDLKYFPTASFLQEIIEISRPLPALTQIRVPILALLSSGITYTDPGITQKMLAGNAQVQTVTVDAYHWPLTEKPQQVREAIEKWCERFDT
jgi:pimeloyl-ACP methyl ester carboxylesterase